MTTLILMFLLLTKHFVVDFLVQTRYQYLNKGTYLHPGGLLHSFLHGITTFVIFYAFTPLALVCATIDAFVHYHVDWAKVNITRKLGYGPTTHEQYWWLMGLDQYLHHITYVLIVLLII